MSHIQATTPSPVKEKTFSNPRIKSSRAYQSPSFVHHKTETNYFFRRTRHHKNQSSFAP